MTKFEPAREDGTKAFDVEVRDWGRIETRKVYAESATAARRKVVLGRYAKIGTAKRTPAPDETQET